MQNKRHIKILEKSILKSLVPIVIKNKQFERSLQLIGKVNNIQITHTQLFRVTDKKKSLYCNNCKRNFENLLLFILHIELLHSSQCEIIRYQFDKSDLVITVSNIANEKIQTFQKYQNKLNFQLLLSLSTRINTILNRIFAKFDKKQEKRKIQYFHSNDIFNVIGTDSEGQDSEAEIGQIEKQLQTMRISDFTDVNQSDKHFFLTWNDAVYEAKRNMNIIDNKEMLNILQRFAKSAHKHGIKRINLVIHAWTLWSAGKITADDVSIFLLTYDRALK